MSFNYQHDQGMRIAKNSSGADVGQYEVLEIDGVDHTPTDNATGWLQRQTIDGGSPSAGAKFCITQRAIPIGKYGPVVISGVTPCKIEVSDENHTHAISGTTSTKLTSAASGAAKVLWKESGTGEKDALVLLGNDNGTNNRPQFCDIQWERGSVSTSTTATVYDLPIDDAKTTDSTVFDIESSPGVLSGDCYLLKPGMYSIVAPFYIHDTGTLDVGFNITDDGSTARSFSKYSSHVIENMIALADSAESTPWTNNLQLSYVEWKGSSLTTFASGATQSITRVFTHARPFYLPQSEIDDLTDVQLKNMIRYASWSSTGNLYHYDQNSDAMDVWTTVIYWGDYDSDDFTRWSDINIPAAAPP